MGKAIGLYRVMSAATSHCTSITDADLKKVDDKSFSFMARAALAKCESMNQLVPGSLFPEFLCTNPKMMQGISNDSAFIHNYVLLQANLDMPLTILILRPRSNRSY